MIIEIIIITLFSPEKPVITAKYRFYSAWSHDVVHFKPEDKADEAAQAFERYDLVSAPVVDEDNIVIRASHPGFPVVDLHPPEESEAEQLAQPV